MDGKKNAEDLLLRQLTFMKAFMHHAMAVFYKQFLFIGRPEASGIIIPEHLRVNQINDSARDWGVGYHVGTPFHAGSTFRNIARLSVYYFIIALLTDISIILENNFLK